VNVVGDQAGTDREETPQERSTRKWNEMLQELRVAQTGVQVLTGFLLTLPFSSRFDEIEQVEKVAYLITVCSSILAAGFLIAPVAFHRVLFGKHEKEWLVEAANQAARAGLTLLAVTMCGVVFLVFSLVVGRVAAYVASGVTLLVLAALWLVVPIMGGEEGPLDTPGSH
jgi:hypothetical protein